MTFLHPALLTLLPLAAIPVLLHLLALFRFRTVDLSTFRFLFDSYVEQRRRVRLLDILLACLRTAFLLSLVVVLARPVVRHWSGFFGPSAGREIVVVIDCSASMNARTAGMTSLDRARSAAIALVEQLPPEDRVSLVRLTTQAEVVFSRFRADSEPIREAIENISSTPSRGNIYSACLELFENAAFLKPGQALYLFTDCQSSGWREARDQGLAQILPSGTELVVVNVGSRVPFANWAVEGEPPSENLHVVGLPLTLRPRVANHSNTESSEVTIGVVVDDREIDRLRLHLRPGETASRDIVYTPDELGVKRCRFDVSSDSFPDDNSYLFTVHVCSAIKILVVSGPRSPDPLDNDALYLTTALQSRGTGADTGLISEKAESADERSRLELIGSADLKEITESQLNAATLESVSVVMLANAGGLNQQQFNLLRDFVAAGGGLAIWPGDKVQPDVYTKQFFRPPASQAGGAKRGASAKGASTDPLLEVSLGAPVGSLDQPGQGSWLGAIDVGHPVFRVFQDPEAKYFGSARFLRRFPIDLAADRVGTWPLAQFEDGSPAVVEGRFGQGRVVLCAFPAGARWSNLPLKPEFVPFVLRIGCFLMRRAEIEGPSVVLPHGSAELLADAAWAPVSAQVTDPDRHQATLVMQRQEDRFAGAFDATATRGYYTAQVRGGSPEHPRQGVLEFAVNLSPEESDFAMISENELNECLAGANWKLVDASAEAQQTLGRVGGREKEVWRPLIGLLFMIIGVEFLLATVGGVRAARSPSILDRVRALFPGPGLGTAD